MKSYTLKIIKELIENYPNLKNLENDIIYTIEEILKRIRNGGKILVCGNGGSASDSEHIVGELLKEFYIKRNIKNEFAAKLEELYPEDGLSMAKLLQRGIPAISLVSQIGFITAYGNDASYDMVYAQQVYVYGQPNDIFIGLSTSGNSTNVYNAAKIAKAKDLFVISLTGISGGLLKDVSDVTLKAPADETYKIQEYHLPIYHLICRALEYEMFGEE